MKRNYLKGVRIALAILFFVPITLFFIDSWHKLPPQVHVLLHLQLVPALLAGMWITVIALLLLTLLLGRIYCSVICPAGILQDIFIRFSRRGKKKNKKKRWFMYRPAYNIFRYVLLSAVILSFLFGATGLLLMLDPYSNFGRIVSNLLRPLVIWGNNALADGLMAMDNYSLYHITIQYVTGASIIAAVVALVVFAGMSILRGRLFCNTLCPVGGLLSLISRYSFFRISFDKEACNNCGNCERTCKAECINSREKTVDTSRCITCFNCISACKKGGLQYRFLPDLRHKEVKQEEACETNSSRRSFITTGATLLGTLSFIPGWARRNRKRKRSQCPDGPITPPGSISQERFTEKCTACHLCVIKCPNQILKPAGLEFGFNYLLKPHVVYEKAYCNYECTVCSEVCPNLALKDLLPEEKVTTQIGVAHFEKDLCVVYNDETDCGACSEHCPTQAVKMVPYKGMLRIPEVNPDICIGCGGCEYICPVRPDRAIHIVANAIHKKVQKPEYEQVEEKKIDDFGF
ncbi:4Fe-4S binding protein [Parabacteroides pacaensis]|uniref:4Fe-4S binding protein n=1 Tax=Parabacteroides pacaensis TaxID=2086575 RepID=UPI001F3CAD59|nr:4Fe-4S binding protein [Parabacteroides pacaensis]